MRKSEGGEGATTENLAKALIVKRSSLETIKRELDYLVRVAPNSELRKRLRDISLQVSGLTGINNKATGTV